MGQQEEAGKAVFRRWFERAWNAGDYAVAEEVIAPQMQVHGAGGQPVEMGPAGLADLIRTWRGAFPDGAMSVDGLIAEGDKVAALLTWRGTHSGSFYGVPASGASVVCTSVGIDEVRDGKVTGGWGELDMVGLMQQIGAMPAAGPGTTAHSASAEWGPATGPVPGPASTPLPEAKALAERYVRAVAAGEPVDELAAEDLVVHDPCFGAADRKGLLAAGAALRAALPDLAVDEVDLVLGEGDVVAVHSIRSGTSRGEYAGTAPSGRSVRYTQSDVVRVRDGRVVEHWVSADTLALLQATGVLPGAE